MPPVSVTWDPPSDADLAPDSPRYADSLKRIRDMGIFLFEWMGGLDYTPGVDHAHDDIDSKGIGSVVSPNFIINSLPQADATEAWTKSSGVSLSSEIGYEFSGGAGESLYQVMLADAQNKDMLGTGNDWVVSLFAKANGAASGNFQFGFANNSTSTYLTGSRGDIPGASLTTNWQRFWMKLEDKLPGASLTEPRFLMRVSSALGTSLWVSGFCVYIGGILVPFNFCPIDNSDHNAYKRLSDDVPVWDKTIGMDDAVLISAA